MRRRRQRDGILRRVLSAMGFPRTITVGDASYRERSSEPLLRALSARGSGSKDYEVRFRGGERMHIRCTRTRLYADLVGDRTPTSVRAVEPIVRPGMRVLLCPGGTGTLADRFARLVGPSGAIVSLDEDEESVRFASRRYRLENVAFEVGSTREIGGETEGAFDAAVIGLTSECEEDARAVISEAMRIVVERGWLLVRAEGGRLDELGRGRPADARALLRDALAAAQEQENAPNAIGEVRWLDEPTGTPAALLVMRGQDPPGDAHGG